MHFNTYTFHLSGLLVKSYHIHNQDDIYLSAKKKAIFSKDYLVTNGKEELLYVIRRVAYSMDQFDLLEFGNKIGTIKKATFSNMYELSIKHMYYQLEGNMMASKFVIRTISEEIGKVSRRPYESKNKTGIAIESGHPDHYILSLLIVMEIVKQSHQ